MNITRTLVPFIKEDLSARMVFIGGPRQVGKTSLAKTFLDKPEQYLNWDLLADRELIRNHAIDLFLA